MRTQHLFAVDRASLTGLFLLSIPFSFWIAVIFEQVFNKPFFFNSVFVAIDEMSPLISILLLVVLPLIALGWNLLNIIKVGVKREGDEIITTLTVQTKLVSMGVIAFAALNVALIACYVFIENFSITIR